MCVTSVKRVRAKSPRAGRLFNCSKHYYIAIVLAGYGVGVDVLVEVAVKVGVDVAVKVGVNVGVDVAVAVSDGVVVNVDMGGWALCLVIRGLTHSAKSSCEVPFASTVKINLTFSPLSELRSTFTA